MAALRLRVRSGRHGSPELGDSPRVYAHASHAGPCQHTEARARGLKTIDDRSTSDGGEEHDRVSSRDHRRPRLNGQLQVR